MDEQLRWAVGGRVEYSDLNAMLLGWVVEAASGMPLDEFAAHGLSGDGLEGKDQQKAQNAEGSSVTRL